MEEAGETNGTLALPGAPETVDECGAIVDNDLVKERNDEASVERVVRTGFFLVRGVSCSESETSSTFSASFLLRKKDGLVLLMDFSLSARRAAFSAAFSDNLGFLRNSRDILAGPIHTHQKRNAQRKDTLKDSIQSAHTKHTCEK